VLELVVAGSWGRRRSRVRKPGRRTRVSAMVAVGRRPMWSGGGWPPTSARAEVVLCAGSWVASDLGASVEAGAAPSAWPWQALVVVVVCVRKLGRRPRALVVLPDFAPGGCKWVVADPRGGGRDTSNLHHYIVS
jgi:hypothetical protein